MSDKASIISGVAGIVLLVIAYALGFVYLNWLGSIVLFGVGSCALIRGLQYQEKGSIPVCKLVRVDYLCQQNTVSSASSYMLAGLISGEYNVDKDWKNKHEKNFNS